MKIEESRAEQAEAWIYGMVGFTRGVYQEYVKPYPVVTYMFMGLLGGVAVARAIERHYPDE